MDTPGKASIFDTLAVQKVRRELRVDPGVLRRVQTRLCKHFAGPAAALDELPPPIRTAFSEQLALRHLSLEHRQDSQIDGASKLVLATERGHRIETVLLRAGTGRVAVCLSTQVGCAANCDFCATGKMGLRANLTAAEMLDQVVIAGEQLAREQRRPRNIVLMGMGEPFHNFAAVCEFVERLLDPGLFHHPPTRLLISTVGIVDAMREFAARYPQVNLALSLHSVDQQVREQLIPVAKQHRLDDLRTAILEMQTVSNRSVMLEYLLLAGLNDSPADADSLVEWTTGMNVHLNLIPFNTIAGAPHLVGSSRPTREAFANRLKSAGRTTTLRYSMGSDIAAACGQLVQKLDRAGARISPAANELLVQ